MPRRREQSDLEVLFWLLFNVFKVLVGPILYVIIRFFNLLNFKKSSPPIRWHGEARYNRSFSQPSCRTNHKFVYVEPTEPKNPSYWNISLLNKLEWKRFEEVVSDYYRLIGYRSKVTRMGADGGVDIMLYHQQSEKPAILIQCKSWSKKVGVNVVQIF